MPGYNDRNITIDNARLIFRNFAGKEDQFNQEGNRNFSVLLDEKTAEVLTDDGWVVKWLRPREEGDAPQAYLTVAVKYHGRSGTKVRPPKIVLISSKGRNALHEQEVELLDWADIEKVDLIVRPHDWNVNGKSGVKAYLKTMFVTIREDELEMRYSEIDELPSRSGRVED